MARINFSRHRSQIWIAIQFTLFFGLCVFPSKSQINSDTPKDKYEILILSPFSSWSHRYYFLTLAEALAERGHTIYMINGWPPGRKHKNVIEINHGINAFDFQASLFEIREKDITGGWKYFNLPLPKLVKMYDNPKILDIYKRRDEFDLIFVDEIFNEVAYPFVVGKTFAVIAAAGLNSPTSATLGNVLNPSYTPSINSDYPRPYSFINRIANLANHLYLPIYWRIFEIFPLLEKTLSERFPDLPPLGEIEKGIFLVLQNTHYSMDIPVPLLPSQVEVGGLHCRPAKPLPKDLQEFIDESGSDGVIYFSLGTVCQGSTIPENFKKILVEAFSKLKQRVIWKFEEEFENLPKNIMIKNFLPQQDILGHPKVRLFITHGGLLSMQESIYHGKPLLALPVFGDQVKNAERVKYKGFGDYLVWEDLTVEIVISKVEEIINNPNYTSTVEYISNAFRDQPMPPLEKAVWWTEYVIRNKGAPQLRSPARDLSWIEYLMIDILLLILFIFFIIYVIFKKIINIIYSVLFVTSSGSVKSKRKRE
ncbi:UNVERIFIED_CONTAM: hypothetical protein RMT77_003590 [Armadillidium vulgare]